MTRVITLTVAALGAATVLFTAGCSSEGGTAENGAATSMPTTSIVEFPTGTAAADTVTLRPVVGTAVDAEGNPTIDSLGPVAVDGTGIERATASFDEQNSQMDHPARLHPPGDRHLQRHRHGVLATEPGVPLRPDRLRHRRAGGRARPRSRRDRSSATRS